MSVGYAHLVTDTSDDEVIAGQKESESRPYVTEQHVMFLLQDRGTSS